MKNIGFVSHDMAVKMIIKQLQDRDEDLNFYEIDDELTVIDQYAITHVIYDFNNFNSLEDSLLYQQLNQRSEIRFLIIGNEISELIYKNFKNDKVVTHFQKPVNSDRLYNAVKAYRFDNKINEAELQMDLLNDRICSCLSGYYFLNMAIQYCVDNHVDQNVRMAVIYDYIAVKYHTTKSYVEKSIREFVSTFGSDHHWTNSETILYFYEKLDAKQLELHQ